jgi:hypothetical protein
VQDPEAVAGEEVKRIFDGGFIIGAADGIEVAPERFCQGIVQRDLIALELSFIEQVQD